MTPRFISLFSGVGLHDLGLVRAGWEVAAQCETDPWCRAVLEKHWPGILRWEDVRDVTAESVRAVGGVDLVTGGFPCPDLSCAGRGVGLLRGERSSLWLAMLDVVRLARPAFVLAENVPALYARGIDTVLHGLEEEGYAAWPVVVGAWALGAPQRRDRVWIVGVAHDHGGALRLEPGRRDGAGGTAREAELGGECALGTAGGYGTGLAEHEGERVDPRAEFPAAVRGDGARMAGGTEGGRGAVLGDADARRGQPDPLGGREGVERTESLGEREPADERHAVAARGQTRMEPGNGRFGPWPAGRGEGQYPWEPPRLAQFGVGGVPAGGAAGVDGAAGGDRKGALRQARYEKWCNGQRLRALGNANPPGVPELIGRWFLNILEAGRV